MGNFSELRSSNRLSFIWLMVTICFGTCSLYLIFNQIFSQPDSILLGLNQLLIGLTFGSGVATAISKLSLSVKEGTRYR